MYYIKTIIIFTFLTYPVFMLKYNVVLNTFCIVVLDSLNFLISLKVICPQNLFQKDPLSKA